ncbi:MAG: hypothetical protein QXZ13_04160 [Candidatus Diapherotrites archaeon]
MGITIRSSIYPLRQKLSEKEPIELSLEIENEEPKTKMVTIEVFLPEVVSFSHISLNKELKRKIEAFKPFENHKEKIPVYLSRYARPGNFLGKIVVSEHYREFGVIEKQFRKEVPFRIYE